MLEKMREEEPAMIPANEVARLKNALPFWMSLVFIPLFVIGLLNGGWMLALTPLYAWGLLPILDLFEGLNLENNDPETSEQQLFWYRLITMIWAPIQFVLVFTGVWAVTHLGYFSTLEKFALMFGVGVVSGSVGIVYAHELVHQRNKWERRLGDGLLAMVLYGHFRSEHLLVHHRYVGTSRDAVTARYNENFHRFYLRVLVQCFASAWRAEKDMLERKGLTAWNRANPFLQYAAAQLAFLFLAFLIGGWVGVGFFVFQASIAIWVLELVNYIEHYGLTRKYLGDGKYEHIMPRHSWNSAHKISNWALVNLARHSDHHYKPSRRFPLLQNHPEQEAPQLPFGYGVMTIMALIPPLWLRRMNPRVQKWRAMYYPEITDWSAYKAGTLPKPKGAS